MSILSISQGFSARSLFGGRTNEPAVDATNETQATPTAPAAEAQPDVQSLIAVGVPPSVVPPAASAPSAPVAVDASALVGLATENRQAPRWPAAQFPLISGLRFSPHGIGAKLVNMSQTGLLAECGVRLKPAAAVTIMFDGTFSPATVEGRVVRCSVAAMGRDGRLQYHVGIAFEAPIALGVPAPASVVAARVSASGPAVVSPVRNRW